MAAMAAIQKGGIKVLGKEKAKMKTDLEFKDQKEKDKKEKTE